MVLLVAGIWLMRGTMVTIMVCLIRAMNQEEFRNGMLALFFTICIFFRGIPATTWSSRACLVTLILFLTHRLLMERMPVSPSSTKELRNKLLNLKCTISAKVNATTCTFSPAELTMENFPKQYLLIITVRRLLQEDRLPLKRFQHSLQISMEELFLLRLPGPLHIYL